MKVWGNIYPHNGTVPDKRFYWEHTITPNQMITNPYWEGTGSNTRQAILQEEAWWDSHNDWVIGGGDMDAITGEPTGNNVIYGNTQTIAKDTGFVWTFTRNNGGAVGGLKYTLLPGDWNKDGVVNVTDVIGIINIVLDGGEITNGSDCDLNWKMSIQDVICTINISLQQQP